MSRRIKKVTAWHFHLPTYPPLPAVPALRCILFMWDIWNYFWWPLSFLSPGTGHIFSQSARSHYAFWTVTPLCLTNNGSAFLSFSPEKKLCCECLHKNMAPTSRKPLNLPPVWGRFFSCSQNNAHQGLKILCGWESLETSAGSQIRGFSLFP